MSVIFLMGPTGSGKTELAVELVKQLPVEIISVDSAMVYRGMDIGTAKPAPEILDIAPHRLIDICDPREIYSAGRFHDDALSAIKEIQTDGKIPLLVGGTGLYFRSLEKGFSNLPTANTEIRAQLEQDAKESGWLAMHDRLAMIDSESAQRIHPNDPQRIQRALEIYEITGKPMSSFLSKGRVAELPSKPIKIVISPEDRGILHERIRGRFVRMIELGLIDEVRDFYACEDIEASLPSMRMVGYRQVWQHLDGLIDYPTMLENAIAATRQLAKRQLTWLRSEQDRLWLDSSRADVCNHVVKFLKEDRSISCRL